MTILVFGGTGTVGRSLVALLRAKGAKVRVITRSEERAASLGSGIETVIADMDDPPSLRPAFQGVESVFLLAANSPQETHQGLTTLAIATESPLKHLVYLSNDLSVTAPLVPHAGAKIAIETALGASGIPHTILRPTYFAQNDLLFKDALLAGAYPAPLGSYPVARVDSRDVAQAAASALLEPPAQSRALLLSGLDAPNGEETASLWSAALGQTVHYPNLTPEAFTETAGPFLPAWLTFDLLIMYRIFAREGHPPRKQDLEAQDALLPDGPRSYRSFVEETAAAWQGAQCT
ncbi:MAG: NmrA family NAD(P)-binding protein [Pseudomonadota bacterium]